MQAELYTEMYKICQWFNNINTIYVHLQPKNIAELKSCNLLHVDLIGPYRTYIMQQNMGGAISKKDVSLFMIIFDPIIECFEIVKIPTYNLYEVTGGNDKYIYKSSIRVR